MTNKILIQLSLAVVVTVMNVSLAFCQAGILDVAMRQASGDIKEVSISPMIGGETEVTILHNGHTVLETVAPQFASIPVHLAPGVYQIIATHRPTERRQIRVLRLEE